MSDSDAQQGSPGRVQRVVVSGSSGLIGSALVSSLRADGVRVTTLVRRPARTTDEVQWFPGEAVLDPAVLDGADAVVALGGASVGRMPWTARYRRELAASRLEPTRTLTAALRKLPHRSSSLTSTPAFLSASAVGYYGSAPGEVLPETHAPGTTFLARVCVKWEAAARDVEDLTRVVLLRTAPVIHRDGVLKPMMRLTAFGLGGPLGQGTQVWPWVSLTDEVRAIQHLINSEVSGAVNLAGPTPATMAEQGRALARTMRRPFWLPAPTWGLRFALGRDATESLLISDADARPEALLKSRFQFVHKTVSEAMSAAFKPQESSAS